MAKVIRIAIVDESARARGFIATALQEEAGVEVVASVTSADQLASANALPDVVFLDVSAAAGLDALSNMSKTLPGIKVIALANNTETGIQAMVKAMQRGAADCLINILPTEHAEKSKHFARDIKAKVSQFAAALGVTPGVAEQASATKASAKEPEMKLSFQPKPVMFLPKALAIASSTGGPKSLVSVFQKLKGKKITIPVFITQHMPKDFTRHFAKQLEEAIGIPVAEGVDGEVAMPGHVYVAPGDYHMQVEKNAAGAVVIRLNQNPPENFCRPAADPMIRSLVETYGGHGVLLVVMTGMGSDGHKGAEILVKEGGLVIAQDKATSVVWGMPGAVATAGLAHKLYPLDDIHFGIIEQSSGRIS